MQQKVYKIAVNTVCGIKSNLSLNCRFTRSELVITFQSANHLLEPFARTVRPGSTNAQKCIQVMFNEYFIFHRVVCGFHITSFVTEFRVFCELLYVRTLCDASRE